MKLLHCYSGNLFGGIETMLVSLANTRSICPDLVHEFALCFEGRLSSELRDAGSVVHELGTVRFSRPWTIWRARRRLSGLLSLGKFDLAICHASWSYVLAAPVAVRRGQRVAYWAHDVLAGRHWLERLAALTSPDLVIANSRFTAATVPLVFPGASVRVVHCPVRAPPATGSAARTATRTEFGVSDADVVIALASRLEPLKGHRVLFGALERMRNVPNWHAWIIGGAQKGAEGSYLAELQERASTSGLRERIKFLGQRSDVPRLFAAADVYCQPNLSPDSFGISFVEALYAGLPVVTSAIGGPVEIVDPTCGILIPPGDESALTEALSTLIADPVLRNRLGSAAPSRAAAVSGPVETLTHLTDALQHFRDTPK